MKITVYTDNMEKCVWRLYRKQHGKGVTEMWERKVLRYLLEIVRHNFLSDVPFTGLSPEKGHREWIGKEIL